jgi:uncharacterized protein YqgC (DUF456 family)
MVFEVKWSRWFPCYLFHLVSVGCFHCMGGLVGELILDKSNMKLLKAATGSLIGFLISIIISICCLSFFYCRSFY